jgi:hypothetical protein
MIKCDNIVKLTEGVIKRKKKTIVRRAKIKTVNKNKRKTSIGTNPNKLYPGTHTEIQKFKTKIKKSYQSTSFYLFYF